MKKGWRLDVAYVERRERLAKERMDRAINRMKCEQSARAIEEMSAHLLRVRGFHLDELAH